MVSWFNTKRVGPIGVDIGNRSVKLLQFNADCSRLVAASRWDLPTLDKPTPEEHDQQLTEALKQARQGREFRGRDAVLCLGARELFVQNIRVPKLAGDALDKLVRQEAAGRLPFAAEEAELRYIEAADVRQGEITKREVIVLACQRPILDRLLKVAEDAGLKPIAVDTEPAALLRCYTKQFRRDEDKTQRIMFVHVGATNTAVVIANGTETLFIKYIDVGGRQLDQAVARHLKMSQADATSLRRHNGDRRADQQDPEISRSVAEAVRPMLDRLAQELSLCVRYHSVTFRGQPLSRVVLGGGEANQSLADLLNQRLDVRCELGEPLRAYEQNLAAGRKSQWDVAAGLALKQLA